MLRTDDIDDVMIVFSIHSFTRVESRSNGPALCMTHTPHLCLRQDLVKKVSLSRVRVKSGFIRASLLRLLSS
jgi:hypothetical protein